MRAGEGEEAAAGEVPAAPRAPGNFWDWVRRRMPRRRRRASRFTSRIAAPAMARMRRGAQGPNLVRSVTVLHDEKGRRDRAGDQERPAQPACLPFPQLSQDDIYNISQFLHLQVELAANRGTYGQTYGDLRNKVTGDPKQGEAFFKANCTECHSATGDLAKIGSKFQQAIAIAVALPLARLAGARRKRP